MTHDYPGRDELRNQHSVTGSASPAEAEPSHVDISTRLLARRMRRYSLRLDLCLLDKCQVGPKLTLILLGDTQ